MIAEHRDYVRLAQTVEECRDVYRNLVSMQIDDSEIQALRAHTQQQRAYGSERFREKIEALTNRVAHVRPRGTPKSDAREE